MGIQINGNTNNINAGIGSLSIEDINELDIVGVATAANFKTGVSNLHNVGLTLTGGQIDVGSNIKIGTAGVVTATSYRGDGSQLTGIDATILKDSGGNTRVSGTLTGAVVSGILTATASMNVKQSGNAYLNLLSTGTGNAGIYMDASNGDIAGSDYCSIYQKNDLNLHITNRKNTANIIFESGGENERLRIDSGGRLLVGDSNATGAAIVQVQKTSGDMLLVRNHATNYESLILSVASGTADIYASSGGSTSRPALRFITNDAERLRIKSDGKIQFASATDNILHTSSNSSRLRLFGGSNESVSNGAVLTLHGVSHSAGNYADLAAATGGHIQFRVGTTERLRINSGGSIGVSHDLTGTSNYNRLMLNNPHDGSCWLQMTSTATGTSANTDGLSIGLNTSNIAHIWLRENAEMHFATNNTLRWRITSSGDIYPQGNYTLGLNSNTAFRMNEVNSNKFVHRYGNSGSAGTNQQEAIWYGGGITVMHDNATLSTSNYTWGLTGSRGYALIRIRNNAGSPQAIYAEAGSISSGSDYRMKENIVEITNGIETVKKLKPSIYNIRKTFNPNDDGKKHHGFVAHEVQEAIPDIGNIVSGTKDAMEEVFYDDEDENIPAGKKAGDSTGAFTDQPDYQGIDYGHMTPVLAAAIKELITKVETLEAEVASLKGS